MHPSSPLRLLVVERQPVLTPEIRDALSDDLSFDLLARVGSAVEATRLVREQPPDLVIVESTLPEPGAFELTRFFRLRMPRTVIVLVTRAASQSELFEAARVGAAAYLRASTDKELFVATLKRAAAGEFPIDDEVVRYPAVASRILAQFRLGSAGDIPGAGPMPVEAPEPPAAPAGGPLLVPLSAREIEVLDLAARGNSNKIIARKLGISDQTVKNHVSAILRKLEVNDRTEAVVYALRNGWIRIEAVAK
jgi:DNA-binding NarL/FixJ family response regulator